MSNFTKFTVALVVIIILAFVGIFVISEQREAKEAEKGKEANITKVAEVVSEQQPEADKIAQDAKGTDKENLVSQNGDTVTIDFIGVSGGELFPGGSGADYDLTLGSGTFIDGFEEQLIEHKIGDLVEVNVTFPEDYASADLAGKDATFITTVKDIKSA